MVEHMCFGCCYFLLLLLSLLLSFCRFLFYFCFFTSTIGRRRIEIERKKEKKRLKTRTIHNICGYSKNDFGRWLVYLLVFSHSLSQFFSCLTLAILIFGHTCWRCCYVLFMSLCVNIYHNPKQQKKRISF